MKTTKTIAAGLMGFLVWGSLTHGQDSPPTLQPTPATTAPALTPPSSSSIPASTPAFAEPTPPPSKPKLTYVLELTDDSRLIGTPIDLTPLELETEYAELKIKWSFIRGVLMNGSPYAESGKEGRIQLNNGDRLSGTLTHADLEIETKVGKITVPMKEIRAVYTAKDNWRWVNGSNGWEMMSLPHMRTVVYPSVPGSSPSASTPPSYSQYEGPTSYDPYEPPATYYAEPPSSSSYDSAPSLPPPTLVPAVPDSPSPDPNGPAFDSLSPSGFSGFSR